MALNDFDPFAGDWDPAWLMKVLRPAAGQPPPRIDWSAPPRPTLPPDPFHAPDYSFPSKFVSYLNQRFAQPLWSAATLPGDVATGKTTMADPEARQRVMSGAMNLSLGPAGGAPESALATGWAPGAWKKLSQLRQDHPGRADFIDALANLTPDQARTMPPFSSDLHNSLLDDVLNAHSDDLSLVNRVRGGSPYASIPLREMRGQPFDDPGPAPALQPASTPWSTFQLKQPSMPPFPANDPRAVQPPTAPAPWPPPGRMLNSLLEFF